MFIPTYISNMNIVKKYGVQSYWFWSPLKNIISIILFKKYGIMDI